MKSRNAEYKLRHHKPQIFNRPTKNRLIDVRYELLYRKVKEKISHGLVHNSVVDGNVKEKYAFTLI